MLLKLEQVSETPKYLIIQDILSLYQDIRKLFFCCPTPEFLLNQKFKDAFNLCNAE